MANHTEVSIASLSPELSSIEIKWVVLQPLLLSHGYQLPPRYQPDWKPSWQQGRKPKHKTECSDFLLTLPGHNLIDAIRIDDGAEVVIKRVVLEDDNVPLLQRLNSPEMLQDPRNNAVRLFEVIPVPNIHELFPLPSVLLVMPKLFPLLSWHLPFRHVREVVNALEQLIQGLVFLHEHRIAHRDACNFNFMMDPTGVITSRFHPSRDYCQPDGKTRVNFRDRCSVPVVRYYLIDFEKADFFPPGSLSTGLFGQVKDVPEMSEIIPYDPFKVDVYQLGSLVKKFVETYEGLAFLEPLSDTMRCPLPELRPTAAQSLDQFQHIVSLLDQPGLAREIWERDSTPSMRIYQTESPDEKAKQSFRRKWGRLVSGGRLRAVIHAKTLIPKSFPLFRLKSVLFKQ